MEEGIYEGIGFNLTYAVFSPENSEGHWRAFCFNTRKTHEINHEKNFLSNHKFVAEKWRDKNGICK